MDKKYIIGAVIVAVLLIGGLKFLSYQDNKPSPLAPFAQCIKDQGATFFGAFWCPHCAEQKAKFGTAVKNLPYHECSTPDAAGQLQDCTDRGIQSYPTWVFADNSTTTGVQTLSYLAEKTGCTLPPGTTE